MVLPLAALHQASTTRHQVPSSASTSKPVLPALTRSRVACRAKRSDSQELPWPCKLALAGLSAALSVGLAASPSPAATFLSSTGDKGPLAEEEAQLYRLRVEKEGQAREVLEKERQRVEAEARASQGSKLCATPFGVDVVGITEVLLFGGALAGGIAARRRKDEVEKLNEQLRIINISLRQQARAGTVYAPGLSYAPAMAAGGLATPAFVAAPASPQRPATVTAVTAAPGPAPAAAEEKDMKKISVTMLSMEEDEMSADQLQCKEALRAGKRLLRDQNGAAAMVRFEKALMLSKATGDKIQERRAVRGLGAASRLQGQHRAAIKHLERVLEISKEIREYTGDADAYGVVADCYTDLGEFEKAAKFYDKYIETMNKEGARE